MRGHVFFFFVPFFYSVFFFFHFFDLSSSPKWKLEKLVEMRGEAAKPKEVKIINPIFPSRYSLDLCFPYNMHFFVKKTKITLYNFFLFLREFFDFGCERIFRTVEYLYFLKTYLQISEGFMHIDELPLRYLVSFFWCQKGPVV